MVIVSILEVLKYDLLISREEALEKKREPSIMLHMKEAKMMPWGRSMEEGLSQEGEDRWAALRAADQKKMKRYMEPSKQVDMKPRTRMRLSFMRMEKVLLLGVSEVLVALSPWFSF